MLMRTLFLEQVYEPKCDLETFLDSIKISLNLYNLYIFYILSFTIIVDKKLMI